MSERRGPVHEGPNPIPPERAAWLGWQEEGDKVTFYDEKGNFIEETDEEFLERIKAKKKSESEGRETS